MTIDAIVKIVKSMNKGLTKREASRLAQNERRKLQRRLAKELTKETGQKVSWKEAVSFYEGQKSESVIAQEIFKDIRSLQYRVVEGETVREGYATDIRELAERNIKRFPNEQTLRRRNEMFKNEMNQASKKEGEVVSSLNKGEVHAFYAATKFAWTEVSVQDDRNKAIMKRFGIDNIETIYKLIVSDKLKPEDYGFTDTQSFEKWLNEIEKQVNIRELRNIYQEELHEKTDVPTSKYNLIAIQNIITRTAKFRKYA